LCAMNFFSRRTRVLILLFIFAVTGVIVPNLARASSGASDPAYGATDPSYPRSDSPWLQVRPDKLNWPGVVPPEPRFVEGAENATQVEVFDILSRKVTGLPSQLVQSSSNTTPPFEGLLPPGEVVQPVSVPDDRVRITPTTPYPWRTIAKLFITAADSSHWVCSGGIIGSSSGHGFHVLTAGHCVYMHDHGGWVSSIEVIPGLDQTYMPFYHAWAKKIRTYTGWTQYQMVEHDWAVLTLDRNVGDYTGWMGRMTAPWWDPVYTGSLNTAGYPIDRCSGLCMYFDSGNGRSADEYNHWYYLYAAGGQSGSMVWVYYSNGDRYILSILTHIYVVNGNVEYSGGTRLNQDKYDTISVWTSSDTPPTDYADLIDDGEEYSGFSPTAVTPRMSDFTVWSRVRDIGTAPSGGFRVSYYASTDTKITSSDYLIGNVYVSSISPFSIVDTSWSSKFPSSIPPGTYWVGWIIDSANNVIEFDETNNVAYKSSYQLTVQAPFDFSLSNSGGITVTQGTSRSNTIYVTLVSGQSQPVSLSCTSGLPSGASCSFNPQSGNPSFSSMLTVSTSSSTPTGSYTITATGTGGGKSHTTQFTLTVNAQPFAFSISTPSSQSTSQGGSATFTFTMRTTSGTPQSVTLSLQNQPAGTSVSWSQNPVTPSTGGTTVTLTVTTSCGTSAQTYSSLQITGSGGGASASSNMFSLSVASSPVCTLSVALVSPPSPPNGGTVTSSPVTLEAQVSGSGPILGATVEINVDESTVCSGTSDPDGLYSCLFVLTQNGYTYSWNAAASKPGYNPGTSPTWTFTYASGTMPVSSVGADIVNAPTNTVIYVLPDWQTGSGHTKPPGVGTAALSDFTALGFMFGASTNTQIMALDTNSTYFDPATGAPKLSNSILVAFAGPDVNGVVNYYENSGVSPVTFGYTTIDGTLYYACWDRQGNVVATMPYSAGQDGTADMFVVEYFKDANNNRVFIILGLAWKGTYVGGVFFKTYILPDIQSFTHGWYIYRWDDVNSNGLPDPYEVNTTPVSFGD